MKYARSNAPLITFQSTENDSANRFHIDVYSDGAVGTKKDDAARGGVISFRRNGDIVHPLFWLSCRLRRVARSCATAEILVDVDALDKAILHFCSCKRNSLFTLCGAYYGLKRIFKIIATKSLKNLKTKLTSP